LALGKKSVEEVAAEFFTRAIAEDLSPADVFRITITSFLDAYNFDVRRLMKCCIHHVLPPRAYLRFVYHGRRPSFWLEFQLCMLQ
jgi:uncharacterized radical SAM superfamily Fe-S cluster-containing enzyme